MDNPPEFDMLFADGHRTVGRMAAILEMVSADPYALTLPAMATRLDAPRSSVHALVRGLLATGYIVEHAGRYAIGNGIRTVLRDGDHLDLLVAMARPEIERLSSAWDETAVLGVRVGNSLVYVDQVESAQQVRYSTTLWRRRSLLDTSMGKIYLSEMNGAELRRLAEALCLEADLDALAVELRDVRRDGLAFNQKRTVTDVSAIAAGVRDGVGRLVAAVSLTGPAYRMSGKGAASDDVAACAAAISRLLAARTSGPASTRDRAFGRRS